MVCYHPMTAYRSLDGRSPNGKWPITFKRLAGYSDLEVTIPCGKCVGCRLDKSLQWASRCVCEAELHEDNCFVTLTYDNEHLPLTAQGIPTLRKDDFPDFVKRLRRYFDYHSIDYDSIRYYQCGEYGELYSRPHHHACFFGFDFPDKCPRGRTKDGYTLFRSELLRELWGHGNVSIGSVTGQSSAYVARYVMKKITGEMAEEHYNGRIPEFITMSRRPGIGKEWLLKYHKDVYPFDKVISAYGQKVKPSSYFDAIYDTIDPEVLKSVKSRRRKTAIRLSANNTRDRLEVMEECKLIQADKLQRNSF